ncbi:tRNA (adenosine(37)-N6)-threonylcarbamoyltransferase complex ATPase subunit type 1 TsaE [Aestuariimicrobium ganziense]|uniref:tRNA (adenosine(37)-N6)-threonylcarbamoyltransferase complex ATPase subunit type 1 TsaE n=1 Tax=Aestuariimicrobium ganziense TaxID=2773677 RepID=UPI001940F235
MLRLIHAAFAARPPVDPPAAALSETLADIEAHLVEGYGVVADVDGVPAGTLLLTPRADGVVYMHRVSVHPDHRQAGLAAAMVRGAAELAADLDARWIELLCRREFPQTLRWWQRHGFTIDREDDLGHILRRRLPVRVEVPTADDMHRLGASLAGLLRAGDLVIATGELGAGKTTLTQGLGEGLQVDGPIISPTFVLSRIHPSRVGGPGLVHVDAYRLGSAAELEDLDLDASLADSVTLVEWGAGLAEGLSSDRLEVDIRRDADRGDTTGEDEGRQVYVVGVGPRWATVDLGVLAVEGATR